MTYDHFTPDQVKKLKSATSAVEAIKALGGREATDPPAMTGEELADFFSPQTGQKDQKTEEAPPNLDAEIVPMGTKPGADIVTFLPGIKTTQTALIIPEGTPFEEWESIGGKLRQVAGAVQWWIGDWLNFGEKHYGEKYAQALDATDYDYGTLRNKAWVSSRFELSRRHDNLSFSHHQEVASLDPDEADKLLAQAEVENWTSGDLREKVHPKQLEAPKEYEIHELGKVFPFDEWVVEAIAKDLRGGAPLYHPITLYQGRILDGKLRYEACKRAGVTPKYLTFPGDYPTFRGNALALLFSQNLYRQHLSESQRACIVVDMESKS